MVTWALGHLVTLAEPEAYDDKYKSWRMEGLPLLPAKMELVVIRETAKRPLPAMPQKDGTARGGGKQDLHLRLRLPRETGRLHQKKGARKRPRG